MRIPGTKRRSRRNPFETTPAEAAGTPAVGSEETGATYTEAVTVFGKDLVAAAGDVVAATPGLLDATSTVSPSEVDEATVTIVAIVLDNSISAISLQPIIGESHDYFVNSLRPAQKEDVQILIMCTLLDGTVVYPLTRIQDVPMFGQQPSAGQKTADNGMTYEHMTRRFTKIEYTPLRDRVKEQIAVMLAEATNWANPRIGRTMNLISMFIADGFPLRNTTSPDELSEFIEEVEQSGLFTQVGMLIGDIQTEVFRKELLINIIQNLVPRSERQHYMTSELVAVFGSRALPEGWEGMDNERLARWWHYRQGLAAVDERLWLPGTDPKEIRRVTGQMSMVAFQASIGAFREDDE